MEKYLSPTKIPEYLKDVAGKLKEHAARVKEKVRVKSIVEEIEEKREDVSPSSSIAKAYVMQGILKYHGLADSEHRIPPMCTVSITNSSFFTETYVEFVDESKDRVVINGVEASGKERERVVKVVDVFRDIFNINKKVLVVSRNHAPNAKGLGTSSSAGAALSCALLNACGIENYSTELLTFFARYLACSAKRSAAGYVALSISYPGIESVNCVARSIWDASDVALLTIPFSLDGVKTDHAHKDAPSSPFYKSWLLGRYSDLSLLFNAIESKNCIKLMELAEKDTMKLHAISITGNSSLLLWRSETVEIMRKVREIRKELSIPCYFSIDTGPSVVVLTLKKYEDEVAQELLKLPCVSELYKGYACEGARKIDENMCSEELLNDIKYWCSRV